MPNFTKPKLPGAIASAPKTKMETSQGHILVVDDDTLNRIKLSTNLEDAGYQVTLAADGAQALQELQVQSFDLMLLDLLMPVVDGFAVLEKVKSDRALQHIPVIVISAEDDIDSVVRCIEMGAADHLTKPFNPTILRARISACVEKKRSHDREMQLFAELQQRYRQLQELEKLRDDLTHMIVHDLRTPLTSLLSGLQTIPYIADLETTQSECLDMSISGGERLLEMINDLLDISKMEDGSLQLALQEVQPNELVERALQQVRSLANDKNVTLQKELGSRIPTIRADENKLVRVLVNLLGNALKFTPRDGTVTVTAHAENDGVLFQVTDTGEGIPPEYFERIFEKFGQVESRKSGRKMSTGLGLTFCKMAVEKHGGNIGVKSTLGQGSTFSFTLPADLT